MLVDSEWQNALPLFFSICSVHCLILSSGWMSGSTTYSAPTVSAASPACAELAVVTVSVTPTAATLPSSSQRSIPSQRAAFRRLDKKAALAVQPHRLDQKVSAGRAAGPGRPGWLLRPAGLGPPGHWAQPTRFLIDIITILDLLSSSTKAAMMDGRTTPPRCSGG